MTYLKIEVGGVLVCNGEVESVRCDIHDGKVDLSAVIGDAYTTAPAPVDGLTGTPVDGVFIPAPTPGVSFIPPWKIITKKDEQ